MKIVYEITVDTILLDI